MITQNYTEMLEKFILNTFKSKLNNIEIENNVLNYIRILDTLDESLCKIARESLTSLFESIDKGYRNSNERKRNYYVKANTKRTILTIFGEITYRKTIYEHIKFKTYFCYIDDYLGLKKYDYFDPYIKSQAIKYAADNPYSKVATIINDMINSRININEPFQYLSRQTIRNIILNEPISDIEYDKLETPNDIYIMADEKFVATQNNNNSDIMVKELVVFDDKDTIKKRTFLKNKHIFASFDDDISLQCLDYLFDVYDMKKLKNIFIMGDGAKWIKNLKYEFKFNNDCKITFCLDKFHVKQAIHHICLNKNMEEIMYEYIINNKRNYFKDFCNILISSNQHRKETIEQKMKYILNNWISIINLHKNNLKCPMESQISHTLAALLTSRPKGYSTKSLEKILKIRTLYKNKNNIPVLFLNNYNKKNIIKLNHEKLNFDLFNTSQKYTFDESLLPTNTNSYLYDNTFSLDMLNLIN